jgi:site-specific recombinase XerD
MLGLFEIVISEPPGKRRVNHAVFERDKVVLNLLWYSSMRRSECSRVKTSDFNWIKGTVTILGKGNRFCKAKSNLCQYCPE